MKEEKWKWEQEVRVRERVRKTAAVMRQVCGEGGGGRERFAGKQDIRKELVEYKYIIIR